MKCRTTKCLMLLIAIPVTIFPTVLDAGSVVFDIPRIKGIAVDGSSNDWAADGFRVEFLTDPDGRTLPADDFDARFRVGWNSKGLLVLAAVRDNVPVEHENLSRLWQRDCVEIFVAEKVGSTNRYQLVIASGADPKYKTVRSRLYDWRPENQRHPKLTAQFLGGDTSSKPDRRSWWKGTPSLNWTRIENVADIGDRDLMIRATVLKK